MEGHTGLRILSLKLIAMVAAASIALAISKRDKSQSAGTKIIEKNPHIVYILVERAGYSIPEAARMLDISIQEAQAVYTKAKLKQSKNQPLGLIGK
jgi:hypothetical protein